MALEAWCPGGPASVREHMALTVERMSRATREDCLEAVLRVIPALVAVDAEFKHREVLGDPGFLRHPDPPRPRRGRARAMRRTPSRNSWRVSEAKPNRKAEGPRPSRAKA